MYIEMNAKEMSNIMNMQPQLDMDLENKYLLLTPGPLSTSATVRRAMQKDWCTWDQEYNSLVQDIRSRLVNLATSQPEKYTAVLMQGSGSFAVESVLGSAISRDGKILIINNGAYGARMVQMARCLNIEVIELNYLETQTPDLQEIERVLHDKTISHVACVHCETTTGILNPIQDIGRLVKAAGKIWIVDAMSSFGGVPMDIAELEIDFLISSANKCIQGVPGFGFILAKCDCLEACKGLARSVSLDLYDQWNTMEQYNGKWRFTSPTHVVRAFYQALLELEAEGGVAARYQRYLQNQQTLSQGMQQLGFELVLGKECPQSPIITTFLYPTAETFSFQSFYETLKKSGYVIYPGKVTDLNCFRIGNIGEVYVQDIEGLLAAIASYCKNHLNQAVTA
ncbi:2-aminoethylphosphonate--pyruvate transaminase [Acinetobacter nosocomialis]|uniref:2-aminoethylphosphonate--pyruvate transaminase n=1 Tax=Acinetobacter nosocomialis TaxID=106654 RepID=UPI000DF0CF11|nr:2-aminoethylphosphonate--pyruvate transaminase [Acinetobacter nosocomialis]MBP1476939.1 2-aminoethylphosphonate--pyruvate transaminase [Acinetobacter nosocomialis]MBP1512341.1 2-aminoethylphosphonate--pyruvate transaminase [Acinetobacter nosocomialis]